MTADAPTPSDLRSLRDAIVHAVLDAADPADAVRRAHVPDDLSPSALIATGKASAPMVEAALARFGETIEHGVATCVPAHEDRISNACDAHGGIRVLPADHPLATSRNLDAAAAVARAADRVSQAMSETLVLISGGASAHLTSPADGLSLGDLRHTTEALLRAGATIEELNTVRKHLETLKGGRLARRIAPARAHVLVLSDVLGDPLGTIGSGPTAPDPTSFADALAVLDSHPDARIPAPVRAHLYAAVDETPKLRDPCFDRITHEIIANNSAAQRAAEKALADRGFRVVESRGGVQGEASTVARELVCSLAASGPGSAIIFAGETTVTVGDATGVGGRNLELALAAAIELENLSLDPSPDRIRNAAVLTLATDGIDGPTDAAGAFVSRATAAEIRRRGIDPTASLAHHDSYTALEAARALIRTGPTGSNINDIAVAIRW